MNSQQPGRPDSQGIEPGFADEPGMQRADGQRNDGTRRDDGVPRDAAGEQRAPARDSKPNSNETRHTYD